MRSPVAIAAGVAAGPRLTQLIGELSLADPDFRTWWADRHVQYPTYGTRLLTHPLTGSFTLESLVLRLPEDDQILTVMTAADPESLEALRRIGSSRTP